MATYQLFTLAYENFPGITSTTTTSQVAHEYFHMMSATVVIKAASAYSIKASKWITGSGTTLPTGGLAAGQAYYNLCVNGVLQQSGLYAVGANSVVITPTAQTTLHGSHLITIQTYNAKAASNVIVSAHLSSQVAIP
jgi:hypothetical protein